MGSPLGPCNICYFTGKSRSCIREVRLPYTTALVGLMTPLAQTAAHATSSCITKGNNDLGRESSHNQHCSWELTDHPRGHVAPISPLFQHTRMIRRKSALFWIRSLREQSKSTPQNTQLENKWQSLQAQGAVIHLVAKAS